MQSVMGRGGSRPARLHTSAATASSSDESRPPEKATAGGPLSSVRLIAEASAASGSWPRRASRGAGRALPPSGEPATASRALSSGGVRNRRPRSPDRPARTGGVSVQQIAEPGCLGPQGQLSKASQDLDRRLLVDGLGAGLVHFLPHGDSLLWLVGEDVLIGRCGAAARTCELLAEPCVLQKTCGTGIRAVAEPRLAQRLDVNDRLIEASPAPVRRELSAPCAEEHADRVWSGALDE